MIGRQLLWFLARAACWVLFLPGFRLRVFGLANVPDRGGVLIAANHQSYFDPPLLALALARHCTFMARSTLFDNPLFGALIRGLNSFPVRRDGMDRDAVREAVRRLQHGACLILFPEGTRTPDGRMGALMPGVLSLADRADVPIVPAAIEGAYQAWPRHGHIRRHPISVWYGRPISPEERKKLSRTELAQALRKRICAAQVELKEKQLRAR